ncbi:MAG: hypothetical protein R3E01_03340 [Pirellulaceae bacterium]
MSISRIVLSMTFLSMAFLFSTLILSASAQVLPFNDEFNDAHDDGLPVLWRMAGDGAGSGGTRTVQDGSFIITGSGYTSSFVNGTESTTDVSVEATINFL